MIFQKIIFVSRIEGLLFLPCDNVYSILVYSCTDMYVRVIQAALRESWLNDMKTVLSDQNFGRNTSQVEAALKKHEAISADIESRVSQCSLLTLSILYTIIYRKIMFYTIFQTDILHLISYILCVCVSYCGGHHDSDRMMVLVMVSQAETIVL